MTQASIDGHVDTFNQTIHQLLVAGRANSGLNRTSTRHLKPCDVRPPVRNVGPGRQ